MPATDPLFLLRPDLQNIEELKTELSLTPPHAHPATQEPPDFRNTHIQNYALTCSSPAARRLQNYARAVAQERPDLRTAHANAASQHPGVQKRIYHRIFYLEFIRRTAYELLKLFSTALRHGGPKGKG